MIKRFVPLALALTLLAACDNSKMGPSAGPGGDPKIEIVGGDTIDWGSVAPGTLKKVVKITNTGGDTLKITEVKPSCGCTTAPLDKKVLPPGDTASMEVSVDVAHSSGEVSKHMTISSNDSTRPQISVTLRANLVRAITVEPSFFPVPSNAKAGEEVATSVAIRNTSAGPVSIGPPRLADAAEALVRFDMTSPVVLKPGDSTTLVAHVRALKPGATTTTVLVPTDNKDMPTVDVALTIHVADASQAATTPNTGR
jgi:hypothetical protein